MAVEGVGSGSNGVAFLVSAGVSYEIMAAACSSPQTTELNAGARSKTLFKWVHIGLAQTVLFVGAASLIDRKLAKPIIVGAALAAAIQYGCYYHARQAGLASSEPGTEQY